MEIVVLCVGIQRLEEPLERQEDIEDCHVISPAPSTTQNPPGKSPKNKRSPRQNPIPLICEDGRGYCGVADDIPGSGRSKYGSRDALNIGRHLSNISSQWYIKTIIATYRLPLDLHSMTYGHSSFSTLCAESQYSVSIGVSL
jgi:hypothetical protein